MWLWCCVCGFGVVVCGPGVVVCGPGVVCVAFVVVVCLALVLWCVAPVLWCVGFGGCGVWLWWLCCVAPVVVVCGPSRWGTRAHLPCGVWDLLGPGINLVSSALQDGSLTTGPSGREAAQSCPTLCDPVDCRARLLCPWNSPGKNPGVGCHFLLQGIFPTRDRTQVSCMVGRRLLSEPQGSPWNTRAAQKG